jgi:hypothetical protein
MSDKLNKLGFLAGKLFARSVSEVKHTLTKDEPPQAEPALSPEEKIKKVAEALENVLMHLHLNSIRLQGLNNDVFNILKEDITTQAIYDKISSYKQLQDIKDGEKYNEDYIKSIFTTDPWNKNKGASIMLEMLEIRLQLKEDKSLYTIKNDFDGFNNVSLEHIYPQTTENTDWEPLNDDNDKYLIGNMILLNKSVNSEVQNKLLKDKYDKYIEHNAKALITFKGINEDDKWDSAKITARCKDLYKEFITIYPYNR